MLNALRLRITIVRETQTGSCAILFPNPSLSHPLDRIQEQTCIQVVRVYISALLVRIVRHFCPPLRRIPRLSEWANRTRNSADLQLDI